MTHVRRENVSLRVAFATGLTLLLVILLVAPAASRAEQFRGAQSHAMWSSVSAADRDRELDLLRDAGANSVRLDLGWSTLQLGGPANDPAVVARVDGFMAAARSRGLKVIVTFFGSPCWASSAPESEKQGCAGKWWDRDVTRYAPSDFGAYADAAAFVASRWAGDLAAFEVWNEPDDSSFWTAGAATYARLVKAAYPKLKAAAPSVPVIAASLSGADGDWLEQMYAAGMGGSFDGLAVHPYTGGNDPEATAPAVARRWSQPSGLEWMRAIMAAHGDAGKGIWATEMGWSTCTNDGVCMSESKAAEYFARALPMLQAQPDVKAIEVYEVRDTSGDNRLGRYGLLGQDFHKKATYDAVKAAFNGAPAPKPPPGEEAAPTSDGGHGAKTIGKGTRSPKLTVRLSAPGKRILKASGVVSGRPKGVVTLTAFRAAGGGRFVRFASRVAVVRRGRFNTALARYQRGHYRVKALLRGTRVTGNRQARLSGEAESGPARRGLPAGVVDDQRHGYADEGAVESPLEGDATFGAVYSPGPLRTGGFVGRGTSSKLVKSIQRRLTAAGFKTTPDGRFGPATEAAVRRFQEAQGLLVDGVVGRQTMASLME